MDIKTIRWLLIGLLIAFMLGYLLLSGILKRHRLAKKGMDESALKKITCAARTCVIWYTREKHDHRYCPFHTRVQERHIELAKLGAPEEVKSRMYMTSSATIYTPEAQDKILDTLDEAIEKAKKAKAAGKTLKAKPTTKKTVAKKTSTKKAATKKAPAKKAKK